MPTPTRKPPTRAKAPSPRRTRGRPECNYRRSQYCRAMDPRRTPSAGVHGRQPSKSLRCSTAGPAPPLPSRGNLKVHYSMARSGW
jgi:hypothetical protein